MVFQGSGVAMTPNGNLFMPGSVYSTDYTTGRFWQKSIFIHEMGHVWQFQNQVLELSDPVPAPGGDLLKPAYDAAMSLKYTKKGTTGDQKGTAMGFLYEYRLIQIEGQYIDLISYGHEQQASIIQDYFNVIHTGLSAERSTETFPVSAYRATLRNFLVNPSYAKNTISTTQRLDPNLDTSTADEQKTQSE